MNQAVLLVEDTPDDVFFFQRAWKKAEVAASLHVVADGRAAMRYLAGEEEFSDRTRFPAPRLVMLDLKLPQVNGLEVLRWIRQQPALSQIRVVVLTSSRQPSDIAEAYRLGAAAYKVKPGEASELVAFVRATRDFWLPHDEACAR